MEVGEQVQGGWKVGDRVVVCVLLRLCCFGSADEVRREPVISCHKVRSSSYSPEILLITPQCYACSKKYNNACSSLGFIGLSGFGGGLAEYICTDEGYLHALPDNVSCESFSHNDSESADEGEIVQYGAMVEPLAVAMHAVEQSGMKKGDTALVLGKCFLRSYL